MATNPPEGNSTIAIRKNIVAQFCSSIVWIDEEILPYTTDRQGEKQFNYDHFHNLFHPVSQQMQNEGYLVHLHPFEQSTADDGFEDEFAQESPSLESAISLCKKADIILLDWHLGDGDSPDNSISILKALHNEPATRFVLILSKNSDKFQRELEADELLKTNYHYHPKSKNCWGSESGTHLTLLNKKPDGTKTVTAGEIQDAVFNLISSAYPDYLHWAALEIAGKFRNHFPQWINDLPNGTDIAVMQELLNEQSEIREYLPENLLEDFVEIARAKSLESLQLENTKRDNWVNRPNHLQPLTKKTTGTDRLLHVHTSAKKLTARDFSITEFLDEIKGTEEGQKWVQSNRAFLEFCEVSSNSASTEAPSPGSLYQKNDAENSIFVCASQACDCARKSTLLLLKGDASDEARGGSTNLNHQEKTYRIDPVAENIMQVTVSDSEGCRTLKGYTKIGQLRPAIAARIISRFWTGNTRPAVNHPNFARALRKGE